MKRLGQCFSGKLFWGIIFADRKRAVPERHEYSMQSMLIRVVCLAIVTYLMAACTVLQPTGVTTDVASIQNQRVASAEVALQHLQDIDTLIKLDNHWLAMQIEAALVEQASFSEKFHFRKFKLIFDRQHIALDALLDVSDGDGNVISASVAGEIRLVFSGAQLEWLPSFTQLRINSEDFSYDGGSYAEPIPELTLSTLQSLGSDIAESLIEKSNNTISINAVPLGEVQVGASLPGFVQTPAQQTQSLRGVFIVAGSAMLIDSTTTTTALDMTFIPDLSTCPADVTVSRAEFSSGIESREPVGIARNMNNAADVRYFYSEISGAKRPLTIIHYWFADGLPLAVEELAVGPSERWRTWSGKGSKHSDAKHLEVLVVEKESGCILHSGSIRTLEPETTTSPVHQTRSGKTFEALKDEFNTRIAGFSISRDNPVVALIEVRRPFLRDVLQASLADLNIDADFDSGSLTALQFSARLLPFDTRDINCEQRTCASAPVCKTNLAQCKRFRDTRDCSSCLFRNPLNNRCVSEAVDPLCEAARNRQNEKYEADRAACITNAETSKRECELLNAQAVRSCQIEAGFEGTVCETVKNSMQALQEGTPLAHVGAELNTSGSLSVNFSNFQIDDDLSGLKLDMKLNSDLQLDGNLSFNPTDITRPLADCITAWSGPFSSRFVSIPKVNKLFTILAEGGSAFTASWSGFGLTVETNPSPLESIFVGNPQLLANCRIGLTVSKVEQAFSGENEGFFNGFTELEIQPLPTSIQLAPATIEVDNNTYSADARISDRHIRYDIEA